MPRNVCPRCGRETPHLGQHWARSTNCGYPELDAHQRAVLAGCLLAGGSLKDLDADSNPYYEVAVGDREVAEWLGAEWDWLTAGIDELTGDEEYGGRSWAVRTRSHPSIQLIGEEWQANAERSVPPTLEGSPALLRTLYTLRGGPDDEQKSRIWISLGRVEPSIEVVQRLFGEYDATLNKSGSNHVVRIYDTDAFVDAIEPVPSCARSPVSVTSIGEAYRRFEELAKAPLYDGDSIREKRQNSNLTRSELADLVGVNEQSVGLWERGVTTPIPPNAQKMKEVFEAGPYPGGKQSKDGTTRGGRRRREPKYSSWELEDALEVIRDAAEAANGELTTSEYDQYRREQERHVPTITTLSQKYGMDWGEITEAAGVKMGTRPQSKNPSYDEFLEALVVMRDQHGEWPDTTRYRNERPDWSPSLWSVYNFEEYTTWSDAIEDAKIASRS